MIKKILIIALISILVGVAIGFAILSRSKKTDDNVIVETLKEVSIISIKDLQEKDIPLPLVGGVTSENEVTVKTEVSGEVIGVYANVGEFVQKGRIIAEIENSLQRAQVASAEAALAKTLQGSRSEQISILELKLQQADDLLSEAKQATINTLRSEFATADDVVRNKIDQFISNPESENPKLTFVVTNSQLAIDIETGRSVLGNILEDWNNKLNNATQESDLFALLDESESNLTYLRDFLDTSALAVNSLNANSGLSQTTIDGYKTAVLTSRTNINTSLSDISSAKDNLNNKIVSYDIAKKQQEEGFAGGREEDVLVARASLRQAQVTLEKTIIRSPISGTINDIEIEKGNFVSLFEPALVVSNSDALEITTYITEDDKQHINIGAQALIESEFVGTVSEVAPALDKKTKKIEIKIAIVDSETDFIEGESVELEVERSFIVDTNVKEIIVPISALKITTDGIFVFTLDKDNRLSKHEVSVGSIVGNGIIVFSGVTNDMEIVLDARGFKAGQEVIVK
ncbi:MAG: efflux RND transporter periplasmic adaptor subunit [Parcubacteria group bacterium]|nr:efflux RND transporter periplasmic adaptor subunit [Parcubacteria group bacterium]